MLVVISRLSASVLVLYLADQTFRLFDPFTNEVLENTDVAQTRVCLGIDDDEY